MSRALIPRFHCVPLFAMTARLIEGSTVRWLVLCNAVLYMYDPVLFAEEICLPNYLLLLSTFPQMGGALPTNNLYENALG